jgi:hypothetical protein
MNLVDRWFVDSAGTIRAGIILHDNTPTPVGDPYFLPAPYGQGHGRLEKKIRDIEIDAEGPSLEDVFPNLAQ